MSQIDFTTVRIPVLISPYLTERMGDFYIYNSERSKLLLSPMSLSAFRASLIDKDFMQYVASAENGHDLYKRIAAGDIENVFNELAGTHDARAKDYKENRGRDMRDFPSHLTPWAACRYNVEICRIPAKDENAAYWVPADITALSKAFLCSAHTGALVHINVNTATDSSEIELHSPTSTPRNNKPLARLG